MSEIEQAENVLGILGGFIHKERVARAWSRAHIAREINVSRTAIVKFENTERGLSAKKVKEILKLFGLNDESIFYIFVVNDMVRHSKEHGFTIDETFDFLCRADIDQLQVTKEELKELIH